MKKPLMLLSTPNSGSDWLADTICKSQKQIKYEREFFNPATNHKFCEILAKGFGCEYINLYSKISEFNNDVVERIYELTWLKEEYNFTKENFSFMKIPFFVKKFNCFGLLRDVHDSLPAVRRTPVTSWYLSIYESLIHNSGSLPAKSSQKLKLFSQLKTKIDEKVVFCFCLYQELLVIVCRKFLVPVLDWKLITNLGKKELIAYLDNCHGSEKTFYDFDIDLWAEEIISSRKERKSEFHLLESDWIIEEFFDKKFIM